MNFKRHLNLENIQASAFLFGPRMTGKTTLLRQIPAAAYFDLLDPELEMNYRSNPSLIWEQISALPAESTIIIDEIQKIPLLLNYVQMAIDRHGHRCILSGSSARKLKRGGANLLGGRALDLRLHPLTCEELGDSFQLGKALSYGTLPKICTLLLENQEELVVDYLRSYVSTYIREEIQAEALTRNVGAFHRFLTIAVQSNGQVIEFTNISRECAVPASTVKEYYQILEDTLLGYYLWPHDRNERKKARPKFYFFDCGVVRAIQNRLQDPPTPRERGVLFETWFIGELLRMRDYHKKPHTFSFFRNRKQEVDLIISDGHGPILAIECKSGNIDVKAATINIFKKNFPTIRFIVASQQDLIPRLVNGVEIAPWRQVLDLYSTL